MISIIVPIYNAGIYLKKCIESVLVQTYTNWELILIDDGSIDNSSIICQNYKEKDKRINYIYQKNAGVSAARNKGIEMATGTYLYFLDADDYISKDCLELLYTSAVQYNTPDIVCAQIKTFGIANIHYPFSSVIQYIKGSLSIQKSYYNHEWYEMPCNKLIKRDFIINYQIYFHLGIRHEDTLWSFVTALYAESVLLIPTFTYFYRIHNNSFITSHNYKLSSESLLKVCSEMKRIIKLKGNFKEANNYFMSFTTNVLQSYFFSMNYSQSYKYKAYKIIRLLLHDINILPFMNSSNPIGLKLLQIHQILPLQLGYYYILLFQKISTYKSKI